MITILVQIGCIIIIGTVALIIFGILIDAHNRGMKRLRREYPKVDPAPAVRHLREHKAYLKGVNR